MCHTVTHDLDPGRQRHWNVSYYHPVLVDPGRPVFKCVVLSYMTQSIETTQNVCQITKVFYYVSLLTHLWQVTDLWHVTDPRFVTDLWHITDPWCVTEFGQAFDLSYFTDLLYVTVSSRMTSKSHVRAGSRTREISGLVCVSTLPAGDVELWILPAVGNTKHYYCHLNSQSQLKQSQLDNFTTKLWSYLPLALSFICR